MRASAAYNNTIRLAALIAAALCAVILSGCGATVSVYDYAAGGEKFNAVEITVDNSTLVGMEATAAEHDGRKWTVSDYFGELFSLYGYELEDAVRDDAGYTVRFVRAFDGDGQTDLERLCAPVVFETRYTENPFVRNIERHAKNPFNGLREKYDGITAAEPPSTALHVLKYGRNAVNELGEKVVLFPAVADAFPSIRGVNLDGLLLNYVRSGSSRMSSNGDKYRIDGKSSNYVFSRYFDGTEADIAFSYKRPVSYGWYAVAVAAGGLTAAVIFIATRKKKPREPKETLFDRFPYNPEQYRDYDNLPANRK